MLTTYGWFDTPPSGINSSRGSSYSTPMTHPSRANIPVYPYNSSVSHNYAYYNGIREPESGRRSDPYPTRNSPESMPGPYGRHFLPRANTWPPTSRPHHDLKAEDPLRGYNYLQRSNTPRPFVYHYETSNDAESDIFPSSSSSISSATSSTLTERERPKQPPILKVVNLPDGVTSLSSSPSNSPHPLIPPSESPITSESMRGQVSVYNINPKSPSSHNIFDSDIEISDDGTLVQTYVSKASVLDGDVMAETLAYGVALQHGYGSRNIYTDEPEFKFNGPFVCDDLGFNGRTSTVRWSENLICPSPIPPSRRRKGWFCRRGDQLWTNDGLYVPPEPGQEYPPELDDYPELGQGWQNEVGVRIDMQHRLIPKPPLRPALKRSGTKESSVEFKPVNPYKESLKGK